MCYYEISNLKITLPLIIYLKINFHRYKAITKNKKKSPHETFLEIAAKTNLRNGWKHNYQQKYWSECFSVLLYLLLVWGILPLTCLFAGWLDYTLFRHFWNDLAEQWVTIMLLSSVSYHLLSAPLRLFRQPLSATKAIPKVVFTLLEARALLIGCLLVFCLISVCLTHCDHWNLGVFSLLCFAAHPFVWFKV